MPTTTRAALILVFPTLLLSCDPAPTPLPTADPYARGYTDDDFPRVQELAPGVYSYEQLRSAGDERFTTVSMFVVTDDGVLVADGQGSPAETRRLIETIATVTDHPITHVIVCSDHGDHTAGNAEFPSTARFYAHPTSHTVLQAAAHNPHPPPPPPPSSSPPTSPRPPRPSTSATAKSASSSWAAPTPAAISWFISRKKKSSS